ECARRLRRVSALLQRPKPRLLRQPTQHSLGREHLELPQHPWGLRTRWAPHPAVYLMGGTYDAIAGFRANRFHGVDFSIRDDSGVIGIGEVGVQPDHNGPGGLFTSLPGNYKLGGYWDTERLPNFDTGRLERGTGGFYAAFDQMVWREPEAT